MNYENVGERPLKDYTLEDLSLYAASILKRFTDATDKEVRTILRSKWKEITTHYNETVHCEAYRTNI